MTKKYNRKELLNFLRQLSKELGRTPKMNDLKQNGNYPNPLTYFYNFGSWNDALKQANLSLNQKHHHTKKELIDFLKNLARKLKRTPKLSDLEDIKECPSSTTFFKYLGSWNNALKSAGLKVNTRKYSKKELIFYLKKLTKKLNRPPTYNEINKESNFPHAWTYEKYFGSWNNAKRTAGLKVKRIFKKRSKKELLEILKNKARELKRTPTQKDLREDKTMPASSTYRKNFGSWTNALRSAGLIVNKYYTNKELTILLKKLAKKLNKTPSKTEMNQTRGYPTEQAYIDHFGTWNNAILAAGLEPNKGFNNTLWREWEDLCIEMAKVMYGKIEIRKYTKDTKSYPDIFVPNLNLFIDAKLLGYKKFQRQINNYCKNGTKLEFWCVFKGVENPKAKYIYCEKLARKMKRLGREDLAEKCHQFLKNNFPNIQTSIKTFT